MELGWYEPSLDVQDIERSCEFYGKLGFELVDRSIEGQTATVQRGNCRIGLYKGRAPETTLIFWQGDVEAIAQDLEGKGLAFERRPMHDDKGVGALLRDPDGLAISFVNIRGVTRKGPASKGDRALGWFLTALAVADLERSAAFYQKLGFQRRAVSPPGVATLNNGECAISLYQGIIEPDRFQLAFWQGDVEAVAREWAAKGLSFFRGPDRDDQGVGAMLKDPDGHTIHLINMNHYARVGQNPPSAVKDSPQQATRMQ